MRSSPGVSRWVAGFSVPFSGLGAQYHPSMLMTDTLTDASLKAHVLRVPIRRDQLPCWTRLASVTRRAGQCGEDFGPWAWDNSRCYTKLVLRNVAQMQIIAWPLLHSKGAAVGGPAIDRRRMTESQRSGAGVLCRPQ